MRHKKLEDRLKEFYNLPIEQLPYVETQEISWEPAQGAERVYEIENSTEINQIRHAKNS